MTSTNKVHICTLAEQAAKRFRDVPEDYQEVLSMFYRSAIIYGICAKDMRQVFMYGLVSAHENDPEVFSKKHLTFNKEQHEHN